MGQAFLDRARPRDDGAPRCEALVPADIVNLAPGQQRYTQLLNDDGGIIDDLMVTRSTSPATTPPVAGGQCLAQGGRLAHIAEPAARPTCKLEPAPERALLALQGPAAEPVAGAALPAAAGARLHDGGDRARRRLRLPRLALGLHRRGRLRDLGRRRRRGGAGAAAAGAGRACSRSASAPATRCAWRPGFCLYGHDIDETTSPIEAGLAWSIQKRRRSEGGFPGAERIQDELANGPKRRRVGIRPDGRAPAREGTEILSPCGERVGVVTSGGFGPSVNGPVAMGYVEAAHAEPGTP